MNLFFIVFSILSPVLSTQWIDPYDMNTSFKKNLKKSSSTSDLEACENIQNCNCEKNTVGENNSLVHLKRLINMLLKSVNRDEGNALVYSGKLYFTLDDDSFQFLRKFSENSETNLEQLRKLDTIVGEMFYESPFDYYSITFNSFQENVFKFLFSKNSLPLVGLCLFVYIAYNLVRSNFSIWYVFRYFLFIIILVDFIQRYQQLHEEAEEHNIKLEYSTKRDTSKMNWTEWLKFMTSQENCEKKFVSLLEVGLTQVKSLIIVPLSAAGTGMGQFGAELWNNLPFPWNILIFPIMLIFCIVIIVIVMTTINGTPFKVNLMHLFHFEYGDKKNHIAGVVLEKLLDSKSRLMIQDMKEKKKEKSPVKAKTTLKVPNTKNESPPKNQNKKCNNNSKNNSCKSLELDKVTEGNCKKNSTNVKASVKENLQNSENIINIASSSENYFESPSEKHLTNLQ